MIRFSLILLLLVGCASKTQKMELIWHTTNENGDDCLFIGEGVSVQQAKKLSEQWKLSPCGINLDEKKE